jgi:cyclomaltodextrinase / maltogenic alpha-amylase / neopullulanase
VNSNALLTIALLGAASAACAQSVCQPDPLAGRAIYLRGTFNGWSTPDSQRLHWACDRYQLVTPLAGEHKFKIGDEGWSADADFGSDPTAPQHVALRGREFQRRFAGTYRITLTMNDPKQPALDIEACPADGAPLGATQLFLRGSMNNWAALDDYAFRFSCDAYYLNVKLNGDHDFKIADAAWKVASSLGAGSGAYLEVGGGNLNASFNGEHTLRLAWAGGRPQLAIGAKTFADPTAAAITDPVALSLRFDSRAAASKSPFGAVTPGSEVAFAIDAMPGVDKLTLVVERRRLEGNQEVLEYTEVARVPMTPVVQERSKRWTAGYRFTDVSVYGYWFEAEIGGKRYAYQNNRNSVFWTREKGSGGLGSVDELPTAKSSIRRFRQTVYAADFKVPEWAPDIVYYYIFPDRFRNGDKRNDPQPGVARYHDATVELHRNWLDKPWKPGDGSDEHYNNDFFGGDLAGIIDKLDYIKELGANTIYMTPVFRAASNHKYDTADYLRIDPGFGSNEDFVRLTGEAAKRGIRVILDTSLNHTGQDSLYFDRFGNFGGQGAFANGHINRASPYAGWYTFDAGQTDPNKQYKGWVGVSDLPELDKASASWRNFAFGDRDSVMKTWLDRGAAGWRMDVAPWVPDDFWREWRKSIKQHKPDALTVAETWFDASKYFLGDMFDSTMNYIFRNTVQAYAAGGDATKLMPNLELMREAYPQPAFYALMNLLSTHDQARALHQFGWQGDTQDPAVVALAKRRLELAVLFQMTYPGAPTVFYGDEVGVTGGDDPFNRGTYPWADLGGQPDNALLADFKRLIKLRNDNPILRRGSLAAPLHVDEHVIVFVREYRGTWAVTATNNAATAQSVTVTLPGAARRSYRDALAGGDVEAADGRMTLSVPAMFGSVLISR